ncbi:hypothetical protein [Streptococcus acidominimus]|uniref:Parvulin-like peptidyl-prolyl isomerase n=1 Tax=Streptococcus acidominimus TaxID=1326 RepID=A0A1Q8EEF1_STRAI|nr:hypothetical protein [Streptococcus acidominimus]OLF50178.1 hypothetical protein BU200_03265 [Streptococcus acidominimus]SUN08385.1 parvulin-like peptidyl-prolyl isomerase [Streptococcus acidominimus]
MYNERLVKVLKLGAAVITVVLVFILGYGTASVQSKMKPKAVPSTQAVQKEEATPPKELKRKEVEDFLVAYYTRKDLGENRNRYKPFMTEGLYTATVSEEDKPLEKTYQGYVVDRAYQDATIYIDTENKMVISQVRYSQLILEEKDKREGKSYTEQGTATLRLTYSETEAGFLVNQIEPIVLSDGTELTQGSKLDTIPKQ